MGFWHDHVLNLREQFRAWLGKWGQLCAGQQVLQIQEVAPGLVIRSLSMGI